MSGLFSSKPRWENYGPLAKLGCHDPSYPLGYMMIRPVALTQAISCFLFLVVHTHPPIIIILESSLLLTLPLSDRHSVERERDFILF